MSLILARRVFKVRHTDEQLEEELNAIVDLGGKVCDVIVNHRVYGRLEAGTQHYFPAESGRVYC